MPRNLSTGLVYGGQAGGDHYSGLSQINRKNVKNLQVAWKFGAGEEGGLETNPIIVGRVLYAYTATQKVVALDPSSGKLIWKFDSGITGKNPVRGLSYWTDGKGGRILIPSRIPVSSNTKPGRKMHG